MMVRNVITMGLLSEVCDSIVWTVNGQKGSYRVYERESGEGVVKSHLVMEWGHCFVFPGDYETCLTAWKDNKVLYQDILSDGLSLMIKILWDLIGRM